MAVKVTSGTYASKDGKNTIVYTKWADDAAAPKAVLQLVHGMAEYIDRYDAFARYMVSCGYAVYGNDHLGHGRTAASAEDLGYFAKKDGWKLLVEDVHTLTGIAKSENPGCKLVLLGHSMGSMVVRSYAQSYSADIDALIVMGTSGKNPASGAGRALVNIISLFKGERFRSNFMNNLGFGAYCKAIENPRTPFDWLSVNEANVDKYIKDDKCGFVFTLSGFRDLFGLLDSISSKSWGDGIRKELPILLVSGEQDPVGSYGKGVREVYDHLRAQGLADVTLKLYPGLRHEILNEDSRQEVYKDLADWCMEKV